METHFWKRVKLSLLLIHCRDSAGPLQTEALRALLMFITVRYSPHPTSTFTVALLLPTSPSWESPRVVTGNVAFFVIELADGP